MRPKIRIALFFAKTITLKKIFIFLPQLLHIQNKYCNFALAKEMAG